MRKSCHEVLDELGKRGDPLLELAMELERIALEDEYFIETKLFPNVDFYSGIIFKAMGIPTSMFTVLFALARTVGWIAQWKEMIEDPTQKISRPRQLYTRRRRRAITWPGAGLIVRKAVPDSHPARGPAAPPASLRHARIPRPFDLGCGAGQHRRPAADERFLSGLRDGPGGELPNCALPGFETGSLSNAWQVRRPDVAARQSRCSRSGTHRRRSGNRLGH